MKQIPWTTLSAQLQAYEAKSKEACMSFFAKCSDRVMEMQTDLAKSIPEYHSFVVLEFNTDAIKKELCDKDWAIVAQKWVELNSVFSVMRPLVAGSTRFEHVHAAACEAVVHSLKDAKRFCAVVSSVKMILEVLPTVSRALRASKLDEHIARTKDSDLPENLTTYFEREKKKCSVSGKKSGPAQAADCS